LVAFLQAISSDKLVILLLINVVLLILGTFMDMSPLIIITTPIFLPVVMAYGVDPVHFGVILILNLGIGLCTPPVGAVLFVSCAIIRDALAKVAADGLVEPRQGAGVFVTEHISTKLGVLAADMGAKDSIALNVLEVRLAIEIESAGLAAIRRNAAQEAAIQE